MNSQINSERINMDMLSLKMGNMLGMKEAVNEHVFFSAIKNPGYFQDLYISRENSNFKKSLLDNPPYRWGKNDTSSKQIQKELLEEAEVFLKEWDKNIFYKNAREKYLQAHEKYISSGDRENSTGKPCKACTELKIDELRQVYLDHNATTYLRPEIKDLLMQYNEGKMGFGNPSSNTSTGAIAFGDILDARIKIAYCLSVNPQEIFFTGSGSEANNLAIKGIAFRYLDNKGHIITSKTEHKSILNTMQYLESLGFKITYLDVDKYGSVSPDSVRDAIEKNTILVAVMAANNEIGTINPIGEIGEICKRRNIPFMVDGIQAFGKVPLKPKELGISMLSFSGHKIYAPKGIGGLYVDDGINLVPQIHGGGQELGMRSGTENVSSIIALGKAAELIHDEMKTEAARYMDLREFFLRELEKIEPGFIINGSLQNRLASNLNIGFPGCDSGALIRSLDRVGISVSAGSACSSRRIRNSHVLEAIGADTENYASIRLSFGLKTTNEDLIYVIKYLKRILPLVKK